MEQTALQPPLELDDVPELELAAPLLELDDVAELLDLELAAVPALPEEPVVASPESDDPAELVDPPGEPDAASEEPEAVLEEPAPAPE
jgi:hypothetical protein